MTTEKVQEVKKAASWTKDEEAVIAYLIEKKNMTRSNAIRKLQNDRKAMQLDAAGLLAVLTEFKPAPVTPAKAKAFVHKAAKEAVREIKAKVKAERRAEPAAITPQKQVHIDDLVRKEIGKGRAVEGVYKSSLQPSYTRYIWFGVDNGTVLSVNPDKMTTRWLDPASKSVKGWQRMQARAAKNAEKKAAPAKA